MGEGEGGMIPRPLLDAISGSKWCVAGGYAACPALSADIDLWIYDIPKDDLLDERDHFTELLKTVTDGLNVNRPLWAEKRYGFVREEGQEQTEIYDQIENLIEKIGVFTTPRVAFKNNGNFSSASVKVKPVHIMVTTAPDPGSLISGFDISTHAVAIDFTGRVWTHAQFTGPHQKPAVIRVGTNTQARLDRVCKRFGHATFTVEGLDHK
jgi:hypothetical protein